MFVISLTDDARVAMRGAIIMRGTKAFQPEHAFAARGKMIGGSAAHASKAQQDDVVVRYAQPTSFSARPECQIFVISTIFSPLNSKLMILAGIRKLDEVVQQEPRQMPIRNDVMDHGVIGPAIRKGIVQGKAEGIAEGKFKEASALAQRQLTARFGPLSPKTKKSLAKLTLTELEDLAIRLLTAKSITELFPG
jgi:hypothetical protein